jgi:hypothetical protein
MSEEQKLLWDLKFAIDNITNYYIKNNQFQHQAWWKRLNGSVHNALEQRINPNQDILISSYKQWRKTKLEAQE